MAKQLSNLQDIFLNSTRKNKTEITVFLMNGVPIKGRVVSFDNFTILITQKKGATVAPFKIETVMGVEPT